MFQSTRLEKMGLSKVEGHLVKYRFFHGKCFETFSILQLIVSTKSYSPLDIG